MPVEQRRLDASAEHGLADGAEPFGDFPRIFGVEAGHDGQRLLGQLQFVALTVVHV
jgi:hypothetical protein